MFFEATRGIASIVCCKYVKFCITLGIQELLSMQVFDWHWAKIQGLLGISPNGSNSFLSSLLDFHGFKNHRIYFQNNSRSTKFSNDWQNINHLKKRMEGVLLIW